MARTPRTVLVDETPPAEAYSETLTYVAGEGDPPFVKWGGQTFHHNTPKELKAHAEGTERERMNHSLIESARGNKHFKVAGKLAKHAIDPATTPKDSAQYRAHVVKWLTEIKADKEGHLNDDSSHTEAIVKAWAKDKALREACEVGTDDLDYIGTLLMPLLYDCAKAEGLSVEQLGKLWADNGITELPW